jgi:hypothetical protein
MNIGISYDLNATSTNGTISIINKDVTPNIVIAKILSTDREKFGKLKFTIFSDNHLEITNESLVKIFDTSLPLTGAAQPYYITATQTLTPPPTYKIRFNLNGGSGDNFDMKIFAPDVDLAPRSIPDPVRAAVGNQTYTFAGWSWRQDYVDDTTGKYKEAADKFFTANTNRTVLPFVDPTLPEDIKDCNKVVTVYAQWVKDYSVRFIDMVGSTESTIEIKKYKWVKGTDFTLTADHILFDGSYPPDRTYTDSTGAKEAGFIGWGYDSTSTGTLVINHQFNSGKDIYEAYHEIFPTGTDTELKVYAKKVDRTATTSVVVFHHQDGTNGVTTRIYTGGADYDTQLPILTFNDHRLAGWSLTSTDTLVTPDDRNTTVTTPLGGATSVNTVVDVYAIWQNEYIVTFDLNGNTAGTITPASKTYYDTYTLGGANIIPLPVADVPTKAELITAGVLKTNSEIFSSLGTSVAYEPWATKINAISYSGDTIDTIDQVPVNLDKSYTLYLQWEPDYHLVTLDISKATPSSIGYDGTENKRLVHVPKDTTNPASQTTGVSWQLGSNTYTGWSVDDYHSTVSTWSDDHFINFWLTNDLTDNAAGAVGNPTAADPIGNYDKYEALYKAWEESVTPSLPNGDPTIKSTFETFKNSVTKYTIHNTILPFDDTTAYRNNALVFVGSNVYKANVASTTTPATWDNRVATEWIEYQPDDIPRYISGKPYDSGTYLLFNDSTYPNPDENPDYKVYKLDSAVTISDTVTTAKAKATIVTTMSGGMNIAPTASITLYAVWKYRYEIRFHAHQGKPDYEDILCTMVLEEDDTGSKTQLSKYPNYVAKLNALNNTTWDSEHEFIGWSTEKEDVSNTFGLIGKTYSVGMVQNASNNRVILTETSGLAVDTQFVIADATGNIKGKSQNTVISVNHSTHEVIFQGTMQEVYVAGQWIVTVESVGKIGKVTHNGTTAIGSGNIIQVTSVAGLKNGDTFKIESFSIDSSGQEIRMLTGRAINTVISINAVERTIIFTAEEAETYANGAYIVLTGASVKIETATDDVLEHQLHSDTWFSRYDQNGIAKSVDVYAQWEVKRFLTTPIEIPETKTLGQPQIIRGTHTASDPAYLRDDRMYIPYQNYLLEYDLGKNSYVAHNVNYLEVATKTLKHVVTVPNPPVGDPINIKKLYVKASDQNTFIFNLNAENPWYPISRSTRLDGKSYQYGGPNNRYAYTMRNDGTYKIDLESQSDNMNVFTVGTAGNWSHVYTPLASVKYKGNMYYLTISNSTGPHIRKFTPNETVIPAGGDDHTGIDYEEDNIRIYRDTPITSNISEETAPYDITQMNDLSSVKDVKTAAFDYDSGKWYIFGTNTSGDNEMAIYNLDTNNVTHHNIPQGEFVAAEIVVGNPIYSGAILTGYEKKLFAVCENIRGMLYADVTQQVGHDNNNLTGNDTFKYYITDYPYLNSSYSIVNKDDSRDKDDVFFIAKNLLIRCNTDYVQKNYQVLPYSTGSFTESLVITNDYLEYADNAGDEADIDGHIYRNKLYTPSSGPTSTDMGKMAIFWIDTIKEKQENLNNLKVYLPGAANYKLGQALTQSDFNGLTGCGITGTGSAAKITLPKGTYAEAALPANYTYSAIESDAPANTISSTGYTIEKYTTKVYTANSVVLHEKTASSGKYMVYKAKQVTTATWVDAEWEEYFPPDIKLYASGMVLSQNDYAFYDLDTNTTDTVHDYIVAKVAADIPASGNWIPTVQQYVTQSIVFAGANTSIIYRKGHHHKDAIHLFLPTGGQIVTYDLTSNVYSDANVTLGGKWSSCVVSGPMGARYLYSFPNEVTIHVGRYAIDGGQYLKAGERTQTEIDYSLPPALKDLPSREYRLAYALNEYTVDNNGNVSENPNVERIYLPVSGKMYVYTAGTVPVIAHQGDNGYIAGTVTYLNAVNPLHPEISPNPEYGMMNEIAIPATNQGANYYNITMVQKMNGHKILVMGASHNIVAFDTIDNSYVICTPPDSLTQSSFNQSSTASLGRYVFFPDNYGNVVTYDVETNTCSAELMPRQGIPMEGTAVTQDANIYFVTNGAIIKYNPSGV